VPRPLGPNGGKKLCEGKRKIHCSDKGRRVVIGKEKGKQRRIMGGRSVFFAASTKNRGEPSREDRVEKGSQFRDLF